MSAYCGLELSSDHWKDIENIAKEFSDRIQLTRSIKFGGQLYNPFPNIEIYNDDKITNCKNLMYYHSLMECSDDIVNITEKVNLTLQSKNFTVTELEDSKLISLDISTADCLPLIDSYHKNLSKQDTPVNTNITVFYLRKDISEDILKSILDKLKELDLVTFYFIGLMYIIDSSPIDHFTFI